jgi:UPF0755 protein
MQEQRIIKTILYLLIAIFIIVGIWGIDTYKKAYVANVRLKKKAQHIYIPTGSNFEDVLNILEKNKILINVQTFKWCAKRKNYLKHVYPGRYKIKNRISNNKLINMLRAGIQDPVNLTFNNIRYLEQLAKRISMQIEADSASVINLLYDKEFIAQYGFDSNSIKSMFIPNTYEFWWNTDAKGFFIKMNKEYERFWNNERERKSQDIGLTRNEISTLASIVEEETRKNDEKQRITGVYMNRLRKGIRLQADPTIKYAMGNFKAKRILRNHLDIESPYNTYKYAGLPPGPIRIPSINSIDAVLNYEKHDYMYFCAKDDFSGYHVFAKTLSQHNNNARLYQRALSRRRIYR